MTRSDEAFVAATAIHESGHAVAARAVGRQVVTLRCVERVLDANDPVNPTPGREFTTYGFHQALPLRGDEVVAYLRARKVLPLELRSWCAGDAVVCLSGPIAEGTLNGADSVWDIREWEKSARALGESDDPSGSFFTAVVQVATAILSDLADPLDTLVAALIAEGELDEAAIEAVLNDWPRGSHLDLANALI